MILSRRRARAILYTALLVPAVLSAAALVGSHAISSPMVHRVSDAPTLVALHDGLLCYKDQFDPVEAMVVQAATNVSMRYQLTPIQRSYVLERLRTRTHERLRKFDEMSARLMLLEGKNNLAKSRFGIWCKQSGRWSPSSAVSLSLPKLTAFLAIPAVLMLTRWSFVAVRRYGRLKHGRCLTCGYDLTGLPEPRCPKCGRPFSPGWLAYTQP